MQCPHPMTRSGVCTECGAGGPAAAPAFRLPGEPSADFVQKAVGRQPDPTATPAAQRLSPSVPAGSYPVPTAIPNPGPESSRAGWPGAGPVARLGDGVGGAGGDLNLAGHSDVLQAAVDRVAASGRQDPELSQVRQRGGDFTASPVSPFDRGAPMRPEDLGRR